MRVKFRILMDMVNNTAHEAGFSQRAIRTDRVELCSVDTASRAATVYSKHTPRVSSAVTAVRVHNLLLTMS